MGTTLPTCLHDSASPGYADVADHPSGGAECLSSGCASWPGAGAPGVAADHGHSSPYTAINGRGQSPHIVGMTGSRRANPRAGVGGRGSLVDDA